MAKRERVLIVGGVAGGASCAARLRRLDEASEIVLFDRGPFVSFANCGLPYYVGGVIRDEARLLLATPALFHERFGIEVRIESEVTAIDREQHEIEVRESTSGRTYREAYDTLVLATGAAPVRPPLPGIDLPGIFVLRTIPDSRRIREWIDSRGARRAVIVGGGFVGLEMAENLVQRGLAVTIVDMAPQVLPPLDAEMAQDLHDHLVRHKVDLHLADGVAGFEQRDPTLVVRTSSGAALDADIVILAIGVRPEAGLARAAGLEIGSLGGVRVDDQMRTSDPRIWAVGDMVEVRDFVTGAWSLIPLAGPANRQGRLAAESIAGRPRPFRGVQGTAVCGLFGMTAALTGATEKSLRRAGIGGYERVYLHPGHHVGYYPGARPMHLKLLFDRTSGRVLGAQAVGQEGVEKRIDVIAMAIQKGATVFDLEEAELCYAPQFGAAKDPVNLAGMVAANAVRGDVSLARWEDLADTQALILDVRETQEHAAGSVPGALNMPLSQLRARVAELPPGREIWVHCAAGQRSYYAARFLAQSGFRVKNLPGGYKTYLLHQRRA
jgi:NADPH-dependent 2,4-dienoyl-CoA reductase/sulfur reductase-like enzyme/rhodanese-related sulfurtransferase